MLRSILNIYLSDFVSLKFVCVFDLTDIYIAFQSGLCKKCEQKFVIILISVY